VSAITLQAADSLQVTNVASPIDRWIDAHDLVGAPPGAMKRYR